MSIKLDNYNYDWHQYTANIPAQIRLSINSDEKLYNINLNTRQIEGPEVLSVQDDHNAEWLLFIIDRYYDHIDLADTCCIIQFNTTNIKTGEPFHGLYPVEFYDLITLKDQKKIIIPWSIPRSVTQSAQEIEYNFRFFIVDLEQGKLNYNLNTLPATATILKTLPLYDDAYNLDLNDVDLQTYNYDRLVQMYNNINHDGIYWVDASGLIDH